jgi:hypothetical protein
MYGGDSMATDLRPEPSVTTLLGGIAADIQELISEHFALLRSEIRSDLNKAMRAALAISAGAVLIVLAAVLLSIMLVQLLAWLVPALPLWACYGIFGLVYAMVGGACCYLGIQRFRAGNVLPQRSISALKEDFKWMRTSS